MHYRVTAKGILKKNNEILFIEYQNQLGEFYYSLPGGGQDVGEDLKETLIREFMEEVGISVEPQEIVLVNEFIDPTPKEKLWIGGIHQIEIIFNCKELSDETNSIPTNPDHNSLGIKWIKMDEFNNYKIYPSQNLIELIENRSVNHYLR